MENIHYPIFSEFKEVDLSDLSVSDVKSLLPATSFESIIEKYSNGDIEFLVNADISSEDFEEKSSFKERLIYTLFNRLPLFVIFGFVASGILVSPWYLLGLLAFPLSAFITRPTYHIRFIIYTLLLLGGIYSVVFQNNISVFIGLITVLFLLIWRHYRDKKKLDTVIRASLENETSFLENYLSNKLLIVNSDRIFNAPHETDEVLQEYMTKHPKELSLDDKLFFCKQCKNKGFDRYHGVVCGLTEEKPTFHSNCPDYEINRIDAKKQNDKYAKRESWSEQAIFSTKLSFILIDALFIAITISAINTLINDQPMAFLTSGIIYYLRDSAMIIPDFVHFILPALLLILSIFSRLKYKEALLLAAILIAVDAAPMIFMNQYMYEPHARVIAILGIFSGYFNVENAKIYSSNLASSNAFLMHYFNSQPNNNKS
ncbi:hypothetical protein [Roseivirga misakiensis]|uniref:Uncharacterized protein n=1 Tax=Roseivirga misakiensis TaxID=1563681 RepID=A0A1E5T7Y0_9BACT|nr:hypothetical protein [Roseivirga misakiensis]OEK07483.1 hypothetical protein BFP71_00310 [Roseivirga misakiensis]